MRNPPVGAVYSPSANPSSRPSLAPFRLRGHSLGLAGDVAALEACLSLERAVGANREDSEGLASPAAIPYCDFLMLRDDAGTLAGICRFLAHGPGIPVKNPLASDRFHRSSLLTALRYSRREILEMGPPTVGPGRDLLRVTALLWEGMERILRQRGEALLLGRERVPAAAREALSGNSCQDLPESLQEALRRGCCLADEPTLAPDRSFLDVIWVVLPEMLQTGLLPCCWQSGSRLTDCQAPT